MPRTQIPTFRESAVGIGRVIDTCAVLNGGKPNFRTPRPFPTLAAALDGLRGGPANPCRRSVPSRRVRLRLRQDILILLVGSVNRGDGTGTALRRRETGATHPLALRSGVLETTRHLGTWPARDDVPGWTSPSGPAPPDRPERLKTGELRGIVPHRPLPGPKHRVGVGGPRVWTG
jgi:hypothetical protein